MTEEQGQLIELISEEIKTERKSKTPTKFQKNKPLSELNKYKSLKNKDDKKIFIPSDLVHIDFINCRNIFLSAFISLNFYFLLIVIILHPETMGIILFSIIFLVGHFVQSQVIPEYPNYLSKDKFDTKLKEILNSKVKIKIKGENNENNNSSNSLIKYTIDITGEVEIPKNVELAKFGELIVIYLKGDTQLAKNVGLAQKTKTLSYELYKTEDGNEIKVDLSDRIYCIKELGSTTPPINKLTILLSLLLLQWIQAIYYFLTWKMAIINPIKLVGEQTKDQFKYKQSVINVHGDEYKSMAFNPQKTEEEKNEKDTNEEKKEEDKDYQQQGEESSINMIE